MIKAAFFDVDGTLLSAKTDHLIPQSTKDALAELHRRGIKVVLCTGRPPHELPSCIAEGFPGLEEGFDAYITMTGSVCIDKDGIYSDVPIAHETAERFVGYVNDGVFDALLLNSQGTFCNRRSEKVLELEELVNGHYPQGDFNEEMKKPVYQFCAFLPPEREHIAKELMTDCIVTRWCDIFCDIVPATSGKTEGIKRTLEHMGLSREETIAFGDGGNDADMLEFCEIGVAMGNGTEDAKAAADYVTTDVDKEGIPNALRHFGLID